MTYSRRKSNMNFASDAKTSGEEFRNRSEGARKGWLKRAREITKDTVGLAGNTLSKAALTLTRPDLVSSQKIADLKRRAREDATFITGESLTAGTLALLLLTKKGRALTKNTLIRTAKGAKGFAKEGFGDVPGKLFKQLRRKNNKVDKVATVIEDISPAASPVSKVLSKGYKDVKATTEVIKKAQQEVSEVVEAARSPSIREGRKVAGKLEVEELDKNNPAAEGWSAWERLRWRGKRDRAQIKSWIGLSKYSDNFWIKFNSRKAANIEFSSNRKPMSEATKRKISKSVARSKGRTAGYDTDKALSKAGTLLDNGLSTIERLSKIVQPFVKYHLENKKIEEAKRRRFLTSLDVGIRGANTVSRITQGSANLRLRERGFNERVRQYEVSNQLKGDLLDRRLNTQRELVDRRLAGQKELVDVRASNSAGLLNIRSRKQSELLNQRLSGQQSLASTRAEAARELLDRKLSGQQAIVSSRGRLSKELLTTRTAAQEAQLQRRLESQRDFLETKLAGQERVANIRVEGSKALERSRSKYRTLTAKAYAKQPRVTASNVLQRAKELTPADIKELRAILKS